MDSVGSSTSGFLSPGAELHGRYRIVRVIGRGGMSAVYEAEHSGLGKKVAIKEMLAPAGDTPESRDAVSRFQNEARTLARLEHRYFPDVTDFFSEPPRYYLVMEFVNGETLEDYVKRTPGFLPEDLILRWAAQICDVLSYLHSQTPPVVFRDLKPSNIMVDEAGQIKLIDFGIARFFKPGQQSDTQSMGTAGYSAPEQYGTGQTDARSDIYSLGACLHFLFTRRDPTSSPFNFPPIREINPKASANAERVIAKCLSMRPDDRYMSAVEVKKALAPRSQEAATTFLNRAKPPAAAAIAPMHPATAIPAPQPLMLAPSKKTNWAPIVALIIGILALAGAGAFMLMTMPKSPAPVTVPSVVGEDQTTAGQTLSRQHLVMELQGYEPSSTTAVGAVTRQEPPAQAIAEAGQSVEVWLSRGPEDAVVPDVTEVPEAKARNLITTAKLKVGQVTREYSDIPKGMVIRSDPSASLKLAPGQPVNLVVSQGPKPAPPPVSPPVQPAPPSQPSFDVRVPVPADNQPHEVQIMVQQTDNTRSVVLDKSMEEDARITVQAPDASSISATVDGNPVDLSGDIQLIGQGSASGTTTGGSTAPAGAPGNGGAAGPGAAGSGNTATTLNTTTTAGDTGG